MAKKTTRKTGSKKSSKKAAKKSSKKAAKKSSKKAVKKSVKKSAKKSAKKVATKSSKKAAKKSARKSPAKKSSGSATKKVSTKSSKKVARKPATPAKKKPATKRTTTNQRPNQVAQASSTNETAPIQHGPPKYTRVSTGEQYEFQKFGRMSEEGQFYVMRKVDGGNVEEVLTSDLIRLDAAASADDNLN